MGEAPPCSIAPRRAATAYFRLPRHGLRRKVQVVRLGGAGTGAGSRRARGLCSLRGRIKLRWFSGAMWRLAGLCVAVLSGPTRVADAPPSWTGVEPCFVAPFVPAVPVRRAGQDC